MKTFATIVLAASLALTCSPLAYGQDIIGMYADVAGTVNEIYVEPYETFDVYVLLKDSSTTADVIAWDCFISYPDVAVGGNVIVTSWTLAGNFSNTVTEPEFQAVMVDQTLPNGDIILLLSAEAYVVDGTEACVYIDGSTLDPLGTGQPAYCPEDWEGDPGNLIGMTQSSGGPDEPVFVINPDAPSPVEPGTWSHIKALYR